MSESDPCTKYILKSAVIEICKKVGYQTVNQSCIHTLTDIMHYQLRRVCRQIGDRAVYTHRAQPNVYDTFYAFRHLNISTDGLEDYMKNVDAFKLPFQVPKYPVPNKSNLNFLKPGSREVVTRPIHIHEHLPPMYPESLEANDTEEGNIENIDGSKEENNKGKMPRERCYELTCVSMTSAGFLSSIREGKCADSKMPNLKLFSNSTDSKGDKEVLNLEDGNKKEKVAKPDREEPSFHKDHLKRRHHHSKGRKLEGGEMVAKQQGSRGSAKERSSKKHSKGGYLKDRQRGSKHGPKKQKGLKQQRELQSNPKCLGIKKVKKIGGKVKQTRPFVEKKKFLKREKMVGKSSDFDSNESNEQKLNIFKKILKTGVGKRMEGVGSGDVTSTAHSQPKPLPVKRKVGRPPKIPLEEGIEHHVPNRVKVNPPEQRDIWPLREPTPEPFSRLMKDSSTEGHSGQREPPGEQDTRMTKSPPAFSNSWLAETSSPKLDSSMGHELPDKTRHSPSKKNPWLSGVYPPHISESSLRHPFFTDMFQTPTTPKMLISQSSTLNHVFGGMPLFPKMPLFQSAGAAFTPVEPSLSTNFTYPMGHLKVEKNLMEISKQTRRKKQMRKERMDLKEVKKEKKNKDRKRKEKSKRKKGKGKEKEWVGDLIYSPQVYSKTEDFLKIKLKLDGSVSSASSPSTTSTHPKSASSPKIFIKSIVKHHEEEGEKEEVEDDPMVGVSSPQVEKKLKKGKKSSLASSSVTFGKMAERKEKKHQRHGKGETKRRDPFYYDGDGNQIWICPSCGLRDDGSPMVGCDGCDGWYHWVCIGINAPPESVKWFCPSCSRE